jgi:hypothetical protein
MRFWDSSALLPLLVAEATSVSLVELRRSGGAMLVWWASPVECTSALARLEREGTVPKEIFGDAFARLTELSSLWVEVQPSESVRRTASRLLRTHPLRAADALQLSGAIIASQHQPATLEFVCLDARLVQAARREGFPVLPD